MESIVLIAFTLLLVIPSWRKTFFPILAKGELATGSKERIVFFDVAKGISILAVFFVHVVYFFSLSPDYEGNRTFLIFLNNILRFAIPVFFICSGALLKAPQNTKQYADYYFHKFIRIFLPYLAANVLMFVFSGISLWALVYYIISGTGLKPFYFIVVLFQFYLIYPLFAKLMRTRKFLIFSFFVSFLSFFYTGLWEWQGIALGFNSFFFFVYGVYMADRLKSSPPEKLNLFWLLIITSYVFYQFTATEFFYNVRLFYGLAVFNALFVYGEKIFKHVKISSFLIWCGRYSLWIYLIHFPIIYMFHRIYSLKQIDFFLQFLVISISGLVFTLAFSYLAGKLYEKTVTRVALKYNNYH